MNHQDKMTLHWIDEKQKALELATKKHEGQFRFNGNKFITHPIEVARQFNSSQMVHQIIALLHDIVEDTDVTIQDLSSKYGFDGIVCNVVDILTRIKYQTYLDYILQVKKDKIATAVKLADLRHNLSDLHEGNMKEKYLMARYILEN